MNSTSSARVSAIPSNPTCGSGDAYCLSRLNRPLSMIAGSVLAVGLLAGLGAMSANALVIPYDQVVESMNPIAYWRHENDATDATGNGHNGTINGTSNFVAGPILPGITGNLAGNYNTGNISSITVPDDNAFSFGDGVNDSPFSLSVWVQPSTPSGTFNGIFSKDIGGSDREWALLMQSDGTLRLFIKDNGGNNQQSVDTNSAIPTDSWTHVAVTYDGSGGNSAANGINFWIDGSPAASNISFTQTYTAMANTTANVALGTYAVTNLFEGLIDEAAVFNGVLTSAQISALAGEPQLAIPEPATASFVLVGLGAIILRRRRVVPRPQHLSKGE